MSADKPEVGDVWEINDPKIGTYKALVINTTDFVHPYCITDDFQGAFLWRYSTETYIGKSKASIRDLFCVKENAENVVQTDLRNIDDMQKKIEFAKEAVDLFFKTEDESKLLEIAEWE